MNIRFPASVILACAVSSAFAQPQAVDQLDQQQQQRARAQAATGGDAPSLYDGESSDVGPQSVLLFKPHRTWFQGQVDAQIFHTDNVLLNDQLRLSGNGLITTVEAACAPTPFDIDCGTLAPRIGYRYQWFYYWDVADSFLFNPNFDFNAETTFADLTWSNGKWDAQIGFDFQRIFEVDLTETYRESVPRWMLQRSFHLNEQAILTLGYQGDYRFTDQRLGFSSEFDDFNNRTDHSLYATFTYWISPKTIIQPFYRFKYTYFPDIFPFSSTAEHENDCMHSFGASFYWIVCQNFNVRVFAGYDVRNSDRDFRDYEAYNVGGGLNLNIRF